MGKKPLPNKGGTSWAATKPETPTAKPSREDIARRAYEIYEARGRTGGEEMDDWIQAERELSAKTGN